MSLRKTSVALLLTVLCSGLTGCIGIKRRTVPKTVIAEDIKEASLDQLLAGLDSRFTAIQTLTATVAVTATSGGEHQGEVKEIPTFSGYVLLRKPKDLQVLLKVPVLGSMALDMVSDGKTFKLLIPPKNRAVTGPDELDKPSKNGLENLRPSIIRDSLLIPGLGPDEYVALTLGSRILAAQTRKKEAIEEPDYDITVMKMKGKNVLERVRTIHISRASLLPYEQDLYDHEGHVVTTVTYDNYQKYSDIDFPSSILIKRPLDEYTVKFDISKLIVNQKLDDEQFMLKIPDGITVQKM